MMDAAQYATAFFLRHPKVAEIKLALDNAEEGNDRDAFRIAGSLMEYLNAEQRHTLSDAIYALKQQHESNRPKS
jgi:hypothetical protein